MRKLTEVIRKSMRPAWGEIEKNTVCSYTLQEILQYIDEVTASEIVFIRDAFSMNMELLEDGLQSSKTRFGPMLKKQNGGKLISENENRTAQLLCNGAIEARVLGIDKPAMSIADSGVCGIITTMPLFAYQQIHREDISADELLYATALSYLITIYMQQHYEWEVAAGIGMACGLCRLQGGGKEAIVKVANIMKQKAERMTLGKESEGCVRTGIMLVDIAFGVVEMVMKKL